MSMRLGMNNVIHIDPVKERDKWLAERKMGIGASEAAAVLGISPFQSPLGLYLQKTGDIKSQPSKPWMRWGLRVERLVAEEYAETHPGVEKGPFVRHPEHNFVLASLDWWVPGDRVVEIKTVHNWGADGWGDEGTDEVPAYYALQVQQQMACTGLGQADIVALFMRDYSTRTYHIERDDSVISMLIEAERDFMDRIRRQDPPLPDFDDPKTAELLALLEPMPGNVIVLPDEAQDLVEEYEQLGREEREAKKRRDIVKARLLHMMGSAEEGDLPDGRVVQRKIVKRRGFVVEPSQHVRMSIKKG